MIVTVSTEGESLAILGYDEDQRWYLLGTETQEPALVLGVMFGFAQTIADGEAPTA